MIGAAASKLLTRSPRRRQQATGSAAVAGSAKTNGTGVTPFSVVVEKNQVLSRFFVLLGGYIPADMLVARNALERAEKILDHSLWIVFGLAVPIVLERVFNRKYTKALRKEFGLPPAKAKPLPKGSKLIHKAVHVLEGEGKHSPLQLPFEWLTTQHKNVQGKELSYISNQLQIPQEKLKKLLSNKKFVGKVMRAKQVILFADLAFMALNGQLSVWAKNFVTAAKTGKEGFSGIMDYASDDYLKESSKDYEKNKKKRLMQSVGVAVWSAVSLPLIVKGLVKMPQKALGGLGKHLKKAIPLFNYTDAVYMSRWVFLWYSLHNYVLGGALAARGKDERREHVVRALTLDFFFAVGDLAFVAAIAKGLQKVLGRKKLGGVDLLKQDKKRWVPKHLGRILNEVGGNVKHPAYKWAKRNHWFSLALTTAMLGLSFPLLNIWYTKLKVGSEELKLSAKKLLGKQTKPIQHPIGLQLNKATA